MRFVILIFASGLFAYGQTRQGLRGLSREFQALVEQVNPAVVQIMTRSYAPVTEGSGLVRSSRGEGSGVIVDPAGYIVTNAHVVGSGRRVQVLLPQKSEGPGGSVLKPHGKVVPAVVVGLDRETDLAVLKIEEEQKLAHLPFGNSESLRQGQIVFAFGSPLGLENSVSMGIVSSPARQVRPEDPMIYVQTDAAINPGNSGGPLVDADGALIGVNTFIFTQSGGNEGIGFAAPSNIVKTVYEQIRQFGRVQRGQIGIVVQTISPPLVKALSLARDRGVLVEDVAPGGSAEAAGIEIGDILLSINGSVIENGRQFGVRIYQNAGKTVELELMRGAEKVTKRVAVLERPKDPDRVFSTVSRQENLIAGLGILAVNLDEKITPMLPNLRRLRGTVVAGVLTDRSIDPANQLQQGDVIYSVNNKSVGSIQELREALKAIKHGEPVAVQVERQGQLQFVLLEVD